MFVTFGFCDNHVNVNYYYRFETTQRIKLLPTYQNVPVIAVTGNTMEEDKQQCFQVGMVDVVTKPVNTKHLLELIKKYTGTGKSEAVTEGSSSEVTGAVDPTSASISPSVNVAQAF